MNQETREALAFVLQEMNEELRKKLAELEAARAKVVKLEGEVGEYQRRRDAINADLAQ